MRQHVTCTPHLLSNGQAAILQAVEMHTAATGRLVEDLPPSGCSNRPVLQVRMSALDGLVAMCELLPREARVEQLLPLVRQHMQPLELELPLQRTLAAAFPRLLAAVSKQACAGPLAVKCVALSGAAAGCGSLAFAVRNTFGAVVGGVDLQPSAAVVGSFDCQVCVCLIHGCRCMMIWSQQMPA